MVSFLLFQTRDPAEDQCSPQEAAHPGPLPLVVVEARLNSQELLVVHVAASPISPRDGRVSPPDKTLQEDLHLLYPTHLGQTRASSLVGAHRRRHLEDRDPAQPQLHLLVFLQGGTDLSLHHQEVHLVVGQDQDSSHLLLHPQTTADLHFHPLLEGGLLFPTTDLRHHPWEVIVLLCPAMCLLLLPLSTPNLLPLFLPPLPLGPHLAVAEAPPLSRQVDRALLPFHPSQLEVTTTAPLVCPRGTARSTGKVSDIHLSMFVRMSSGEARCVHSVSYQAIERS